jgi:nicotinamidase-related amidase
VADAPEVRLAPESAALLMLDHQTGIMAGVADIEPNAFRSNVLALAKVGQAYGLPVILSASFADGPNGPLLADLTGMFPDVKPIYRPGEINAWDNPDVVRAVEATGRKQLVMAAVTTDVCLQFPAMSAAAAGYDVWAVMDCSGTWNTLVQQAAMHRMTQAGVRVTTWVAIAAELQHDWRRPTGEKLAAIMGEHLPFYGMLAANLKAAKGGG